MSDIEGQERGVLRFGASAMRMNICLPAILPSFPSAIQCRAAHHRYHYPPTGALVLDGSLDFALTLNGEEHPKLVSHHLMEDQVYLCVADQLLQEYYGRRRRRSRGRPSREPM